MRINFAVGLLITIPLAAVSGCGAATSWHRPDVAVEQRDRDFQECDYEVSKLTTGDLRAPKNAGDAAGGGAIKGIERATLIKKCMRLRGYSN